MIGVKDNLKDWEFKERKERCDMFRIGFDPLLEAEQQHKELIKQAEQYRLAQEANSASQNKSRSGTKILAMIGKGLASLGSSLESRYGDHIAGQVNLDTQSNLEECY